MIMMLARLKQVKAERSQAHIDLEQRRHLADVALVAMFAPVWEAYQQVAHLMMPDGPLHTRVQVRTAEGHLGPKALYIKGHSALSLRAESKGLCVATGHVVLSVDEAIETLIDFLLREGIRLPERGGDDPGQVCTSPD